MGLAFAGWRFHTAGLLILWVALSLGGCTAAIKSWSEESYRSPGFTKQDLRHGGVAVLPAIILPETKGGRRDYAGQISSAPYTPQSTLTASPADTGVENPEAHRLMTSEILLSQMKARFPDINILSPGDSLKRINDEKLTETYTRFNDNFSKTGLDSMTLKSFETALRVRYIFVSQGIVSETKPESLLTFIWGFGRKTVIRTVKISAQIWDTAKGVQVWEGTGVGYSSLGAYEKPPLMEELTISAVDSLLKNIP
ncbi:MAG TPA: hypothetical protein PLR20_03445 [Syntrophales bacterium]|nr:hypothetical protein [Syntrophales bacterium]HOX93533.1 hypothetical protein [Syntrophales bacterium]HPI55998.1 hypothetical protein [Syntrophales bacterium]HPN24112.1 hypothetical protein [Syntrophales bacterium]HQM28391.1 hypothetical protein [Syntrophales bacterium]